MAKFTVKERDAGEPCFLAAEGFGVTVELNGAADHTQAMEVAKFLNQHVKNIVVEGGSIELCQAGKPTRTIGGRPISLLT